jgi:hypothetical protein
LTALRRAESGRQRPASTEQLRRQIGLGQGR